MSIVESIVKKNVKKQFSRGVVGPFTDGFTPSDIPQSEADALIAFYDATGWDSWTDNTGWKSDPVVGNWYGITVSGGHVTQVDVSSNNLSTDSSKIATPTYANLSSLTSFSIQGNTFGQPVVDALLGALDDSGLADVTLDISGDNSAPGVSGVAAMNNLIDNGWTITRSTVAMVNTGTFRMATADGAAGLLASDLDISVLGEWSLNTTVNTGTFRMATADGAVSLYCSDQDLSGMLGKKIVVTDGSGNVAEAYGYQQDGAEALSDNLSFLETLDLIGDSWGESNATIESATSFTVNSNRGRCYKNTSLTKGLVINFGGVASATSGEAEVWKGNSGHEKITADGTEKIITMGSDPHIYVVGTLSGATIDFSSVFCRTYTALGTTALQLTSTFNGSTRNLAFKDEGFDPNDIVSVEIYDLDLSSADNYIRVEDTSGNVAEAYGYQQDGAEALGSELVLDGDMESDPTSNWFVTTGTTVSEETVDVHGGAKALRVENSDGGNRVQQAITQEIGYVYKYSAWGKDDTGEAKLRVRDASLGVDYESTLYSSATWANISGYLTAGSINISFMLYISGGIGESCLHDDISFKEVTALGTTALTLRSTADGSTRNLASKDASFNPNDIAKVEVFNV